MRRVDDERVESLAKGTAALALVHNIVTSGT